MRKLGRLYSSQHHQGSPKEFSFKKKKMVVCCISPVQLLSLGQIYIPRLTSLLSFSKRGKFINQEKKKKKKRRNPVKPLTQIEGQDGLEHELEREITIILQTQLRSQASLPKQPVLLLLIH